MLVESVEKECDVVLDSDMLALDEVVAIGYGRVKLGKKVKNAITSTFHSNNSVVFKWGRAKLLSNKQELQKQVLNELNDSETFSAVFEFTLNSDNSIATIIVKRTTDLNKAMFVSSILEQHSRWEYKSSSELIRVKLKIK